MPQRSMKQVPNPWIHCISIVFSGLLFHLPKMHYLSFLNLELKHIIFSMKAWNTCFICGYKCLSRNWKCIHQFSGDLKLLPKKRKISQFFTCFSRVPNRKYHFSGSCFDSSNLYLFVAFVEEIHQIRYQSIKEKGRKKIKE